MKKKILGLAVIAIAVLSFVLVSAARADNSDTNFKESRNQTMRSTMTTLTNQASTTVRFRGHEVKLEKINSPEELKNFKVMKRVRNTLYGLTIQAFHALQAQVNGQKPATSGKAGSAAVVPSSASSTLEKIAAPQFIKLFHHIRRIGNALWGERKVPAQNSQDRNSNGNQVAHPSVFTKVAPDEVSCVTAAINAKDAAVIANLQSTAVSLKSAINARSICQIKALSSAATSSQRDALDSCVNAFQTSRRQINKTAKEAQHELWKTYTDSLRACRTVSVPACSSNSASSTAACSVNPSSSNDQGNIMIEDGGSTSINSLTDNGNNN